MAAGRFLLLWTLLLNGLHDSASLGPGLNVGEDYEVVRPIRLHAIDKRHAESVRPQRLKYALTVGGRPLEMHLERNDELLTKDYSETHYLEDGTRVTSVPDHIDNCYYQGRIVGEDVSEASISTCHGLSGYFRTSAQIYRVTPLGTEPEGDHKVAALPGDQTTPPGVCGVTNNTWATDEEPPSRARARGLSILFQQKYVQLHIVADNKEFVRMGRDINKLRSRVFEVVNFVNMAYKPLLTFVALVGLEVWNDRDKIAVTSNTGQNLEDFRNWRNKNLSRKNQNCAHLISGVDFQGGTVGLAYVGALCTAYSVGVVQDHTDAVDAVGATLAHELGHNLGMSHDNCPCSGENCIMEPSVRSWSIPRAFSSCSRGKYEEFLTGRSVNCLLDKPDYKTLEASPVCGNGFVEKGEVCDCGSEQECKNPCCDAKSCQLSAGSQCAEGECCSNCKIQSRSHECRRKEDDCDLAEYCDGVNAVCPEDMFAENGRPCDRGQGYCYDGECPQRLEQCRKMYGPGATEGEKRCFDFNKLGRLYGYCKRPSEDTYTGCADEDIYCGKLFCLNGDDFSVYGSRFSVAGCKTVHFDDFTKDYSQVETGTKCGDGKVCSRNQCVDLETALRTAACSSRCPAGSVCNHRGQCQCEPPNCGADGKDSSSVVIENLSPGLHSHFLHVLFPLLAALW